MELIAYILAYILVGIIFLALLGAFIGMINPTRYDDVAETKSYDDWLIKEYGQEWWDENVGC